MKTNDSYTLDTQVSLFNILKKLNGKCIYNITKYDKSIGLIVSSIHVIDNSNSIIETNFFINESECDDDLITCTYYKTIKTVNEWKKYINESVLYIIEQIKSQLEEKYYISFPKGKLYYDDIIESFNEANIKIKSIFISNTNGIINDIDLRELANKYEIDIYDKNPDELFHPGGE